MVSSRALSGWRQDIELPSWQAISRISHEVQSDLQEMIYKVLNPILLATLFFVCVCVCAFTDVF